MTTTAYFMATSTDDTLIVMCDSYASLPERRLTPHYRKMNNQRLASKTCFASSCRDPAFVSPFRAQSRRCSLYWRWWSISQRRRLRSGTPGLLRGSPGRVQPGGPHYLQSERVTLTIRVGRAAAYNNHRDP